MRSAADIDDREFRRLLNNLEALPGTLDQRVLKQGMKGAAEVARQHARQPDFAFTDRTGRTRKSIKTSFLTAREGAREGPGAKLTIGGAGAKQGPLLELGTDKMKARAPLRRAVHATTRNMFQAAVRTMKKKFRTLRSQAKHGKLSKADLRAATAGS